MYEILNNRAENHEDEQTCIYTVENDKSHSKTKTEVDTHLNIHIYYYMPNRLNTTTMFEQFAFEWRTQWPI